MLFDLLALGILAVFMALGAWRGTFAGFLRLTTLFCAYAAGLVVATKLAVAPKPMPRALAKPVPPHSTSAA